MLGSQIDDGMYIQLRCRAHNQYEADVWAGEARVPQVRETSPHFGRVTQLGPDRVPHAWADAPRPVVCTLQIVVGITERVACSRTRSGTTLSDPAFQHFITHAPWSAERGWRRLRAVVPEREELLIFVAATFPDCSELMAVPHPRASRPASRRG